MFEYFFPLLLLTYKCLLPLLSELKTICFPSGEKLAETSEDEYVMKKVLPNIDTWNGYKEMRDEEPEKGKVDGYPFYRHNGNPRLEWLVDLGILEKISSNFNAGPKISEIYDALLKTKASCAHLSRFGVVILSYPYKLIFFADTSESEIIIKLQSLQSNAVSLVLSLALFCNKYKIATPPLTIIVINSNTLCFLVISCPVYLYYRQKRPIYLAAKRFSYMP